MDTYFYHYQGERFWARVGEDERRALICDGYNTAQVYWGESGYIVLLPNGEFSGHYYTVDRLIDAVSAALVDCRTVRMGMSPGERYQDLVDYLEELN